MIHSCFEIKSGEHFVYLLAICSSPCASISIIIRLNNYLAKDLKSKLYLVPSDIATNVNKLTFR